MEYLLIAVVCFLASTVGALCGIGGGVVIKPILDALGVMSISTASFLSGLTVLSMSFYTVSMLFVNQEASIKRTTALPLSIGAVVGGLSGKVLFSQVSATLGGGDTIGAIQAMCLFFLVSGTLAYTIFKQRIHPLQVENPVVCLFAGVLLGVLSSFLGIGGGPFNLIVLQYLFSMPTKVAAQNSLFVILFSQGSSLLQSIVTSTVPPFSWVTLVLMVAMGILGAMLGRTINKQISDKKIDVLFSGLNVTIMVICVYNFSQYI